MVTTTRVLPSCLLGLVAACGDAGPAAPVGTGSTSTAAAPLTDDGAGSTGTPAETGSADTQASTTGDAVTTGLPGSTGPSTDDGVDESSTGEEKIQLCGLEDLKAGAPNPVVYGTEPMQIPPDIATILVDNCGCHYADMLDVGPPVADYPDALPLRIDTWEQWQGEYGIIVQKPTLGTCLTRVRDAPLQTAMPHRSCHVGDGEQMDPAQRDILIQWMEAGAPDGATWIPP